MGTSEYRSPQNSSQVPLPSIVTMLQPSQQPHSSQINASTSSYANAASAKPILNTFPKKDQAVIINVLDGVKLTDYVVSLGGIIGPKNILFASRISNNRVCIYLSSKELVEEVILHHSSIVINGQEASIRRLVSPARRIIFSNVSPTIPHEFLENVVKAAGFKPVSPVSFLRAGIIGDAYSHVLSFRRQIYVHPEETIPLPPSIILKHDEINYRIYLTYDELTCFLCKQSGHISTNCPNQNQTSANLENTSEIPEAPVTTPASQLQTDNLINLEEQRQNKRTATSTISNDTEQLVNVENSDEQIPDEEVQDPNNDFVTVSRSNKKLKKSDSVESLTPVTDLILPAKNFIEKSPTPFVLDYDQLLDFLENVHGNSDPLSVAYLYTDDVTGLLDMMSKVYSHLTHRSIKSRITRLKKKIFEQLSRMEEGENSEHDTDASHKTPL